MTDQIAPKTKQAQAPMQISMFEPVGYQLAERIRAINVYELRPIEALQLLAELQKELKRN
jgi:DNA mismatch repair protein MutS